MMTPDCALPMMDRTRSMHRRRRVRRELRIGDKVEFTSSGPTAYSRRPPSVESLF